MPPTDEMRDGIEMPRPTAAPLILATGIALIGAGFALSYAMAAVGAVVLATGLATWVGFFAPGRGHFHEARSVRRPATIVPTSGAVEQMTAGMPGYRMRLPLMVHPISAGIKGGLLGGFLMPIPALLWGHLSGHGIWYPINLLAGMVVPGLEDTPLAALEQFHAKAFMFAGVVHVVTSLILGLMYGVLLPALPNIRGGQFVWGGILMPLLWTGASYGLMGVVNPLLQKRVDWPWFVASQFLFGVVTAGVVMFSEKIPVPPAGAGPDTASFTR
jgi:uncharacterized membrane protein YagU involved in acid resistance